MVDLAQAPVCGRRRTPTRGRSSQGPVGYLLGSGGAYGIGITLLYAGTAFLAGVGIGTVVDNSFTFGLEWYTGKEGYCLGDLAYDYTQGY